MKKIIVGGVAILTLTMGTLGCESEKRTDIEPVAQTISPTATQTGVPAVAQTIVPTATQTRVPMDSSMESPEDRIADIAARAAELPDDRSPEYKIIIATYAEAQRIGGSTLACFSYVAGEKHGGPSSIPMQELFLTMRDAAQGLPIVLAICHGGTEEAEKIDPDLARSIREGLLKYPNPARCTIGGISKVCQIPR